VGGRFAWNESVRRWFRPGARRLQLRLRSMTFAAALTTPFGVLKMAVQAGSRRGRHGRRAPSSRFALRDARRITVKATLNAKTSRTVETRTDNPVLGDLVTETTYSTTRTSRDCERRPVPSHLFRARRFRSGPDHHQDDANNPYVVFPCLTMLKRVPSPPL